MNRRYCPLLETGGFIVCPEQMTEGLRGTRPCRVTVVFCLCIVYLIAIEGPRAQYVSILGTCVMCASTHAGLRVECQGRIEYQVIHTCMFCIYGIYLYVLHISK